MAQEKKRFLVILIAGIGDLIMASASLRALRRSHPDAEIHLLTSSEASVLAVNYPYVDRVWSLPVREIRKDKLQSLRALGVIRELRRTQFDLCLNLYRVSSWPGALRMGLLMSLLRAGRKAGHDSKGFGIFLDKKAEKRNFRKASFCRHHGGTRKAGRRPGG